MKEMSSAASVVIWIWPMSSSGKKPFGMVTNSHALSTKARAAAPCGSGRGDDQHADEGTDSGFLHVVIFRGSLSNIFLLPLLEQGWRVDVHTGFQPEGQRQGPARSAG
ncbi:hypothetical protein AX767_06680 [Variovorax sp. PAMC 28711]|nr:hypothetical protein AX767_06680 [Variovorax sp. PAMC 28711]